MNRYENGKIYKVVDIGYNKCYIGSTCESLSKRMQRHRDNYSKYRKGTLNKRVSVIDIFEEYGTENCKIELIENYPCENREELLKREGHFVKNTVCVNKVLPHRTYDELKANARAYYYENKERILEKHLEKVECPLCNRLFSAYYIPIHKGTRNCVKQMEALNT
eukprot:Skav225065  [mRNA]  locus=scaffold2293:78966:79457:+ [translate_table: standard]